jgi:hypothetical protein
VNLWNRICVAQNSTSTCTVTKPRKFICSNNVRFQLFNFFSQSPKTRNKRVLVAKSKEKEGNKNKKVRQKGGADIGWSVTNVVKYN